MKKEAFWLMLSFAIGIVWSFLMMHFLIGITGGLVYILILLVIIPSCLIFYDLMEKGGKTTRMAFLVVLIALGSFFGGLRVGLLESISLAEDSLIDISHSVVALHIRNTGLSPIRIAKVTVSDIDFNADSTNFPLYLAIGAEAYLIVQYVRETFLWDRTIDKPMKEEYYDETRRYSSDTGPTPLTFQNGSVYSVTFHTYGLMHHTFPLKAELTGEERLNVWRAFGKKTNLYVDVRLFLNNTGTSPCCIYTIRIGDVLFQLKPPMVISPWPATSEYSPQVIIHIQDWGAYYDAYGTWPWSGELIAEPAPTVSMFPENETYGISVWTMADNHYTTNVTIT
jgi:hypothetical protein